MTKPPIIIVGASVAGVTIANGLRQNEYSGEIVLIDGDPHAPYDKPPLSKKVLQDASGETDIALTVDGADLRPGVHATGLNTEQRTLLTTDGALPYTKLVIASGARARPSLWGHGTRIHTLRTLRDARHLRERLKKGTQDENAQ